MKVILFCNIVCVYVCIPIRFMRSSLAVVFFFKVKPESKRSPGTDFEVEDMKENIWTIFIYIAANF